jgi:two-component system, LuxR family, response regulator FixJ
MHFRSRWFGSPLRSNGRTTCGQVSTKDLVFSLSHLDGVSCIKGLHPLTNITIAVVDDDEALCASLTDFFRSVGYRAHAFPSAEAFLTAVDRSCFDCIVLDFHMPGMNGLDLAGKLRDLRIATPVILITALPDEWLSEQAVAIGVRCLRKPCTTGVLLDCVESNLSARGLHSDSSFITRQFHGHLESVRDDRVSRTTGSLSRRRMHRKLLQTESRFAMRSITRLR